MGLGAPFKNWMGAMMGWCVLSPAAAKFVLNTILVANHLVVKGVRLFGYESSEAECTWREICSLSFADDWLGIMCNEGEARKVWKLWTMWEVITGSKSSASRREVRPCSPALRTATTGGHAR